MKGNLPCLWIGRQGWLSHTGDGATHHTRYHFCGNWVELLPAAELQRPRPDTPGAAISVVRMEHANVSGNKLIAGDHGVQWGFSSVSTFILKNDFSAATYRGLAFKGNNGPADPFFRMGVFRNVLNQGSTFHLKGVTQEPGVIFFSENIFKDGAFTVNPFVDPASIPVHTHLQP